MNKLIYPLFGLAFSSFVFADGEGATVQSVPPERTCRISYFADASFTYWYVKEDGLDVAENATLTSTGITVLPQSGQTFQQSFSYDPGFKVGLGLKTEDFGLRAGYTWVRSKNSTNKNAPASDSPVAGIGVWNVDDWFLQTTSTGRSPTGTNISTDCKLSLDIVDLMANHLIYDKKHIKVSGQVGLNTVWIRQKMDISLTQALASVGASFIPPQPIQSLNQSHSWGIGPKMGIDTQYTLPMGFRLEGGFAASLLYTKFSSVKHFENAVSTVAINSNGITTRVDSYSSVRPVLEMGLGFGWKRDFGRYGLGLLASYDFSLFWGQNAMRKMLDEYWAGTQASAGDLYMQGLTVSACFKF